MDRERRMLKHQGKYTLTLSLENKVVIFWGQHKNSKNILFTWNFENYYQEQL